MRRLYRSTLIAALSNKPLLRQRAPFPLLHPPVPHQRLLPFSTRTLTAPPPPNAASSAQSTPPSSPPPNAASTVQSAPLALLEAAELQESAGDDHQETLNLALKALSPLQEALGGWSLPVARALRLVGAAAARLGLLSDSLESLDTAAEIVDSMDGRGAEVATVGAAVHEQLGRTKTAMGRRWDAVENLRRSLELKGRFLKEGSAELGNTYRDVAEAYVGVLDFEKALPLCLKALEIAEKLLGEDSAEVAKVRRILMVIYTGLDRNEEALKQNALARMVYEKLGLDVELSQVEVDGASVRILVGRPEEAMSDLRRVMQRADKESEERALALVTTAKILCSQERYNEAKRCLEIARQILDSKGSGSPGRVTEAYAEIALLYEAMNEFETSLSLMKKTLAFIDGVPEMHHIQGSIQSRMGCILLMIERVDEAFPYLEKAVENLKNCFGPLHFGLGFTYKHLGEAYIAMKQPKSAVKFLHLASDIINAIFGPKHNDSIEALQSVANAYGLMGSFKMAKEFQVQVKNAYESFLPDDSYEVREAERLVHMIGLKEQGSPNAVFPANTLPTGLQKKMDDSNMAPLTLEKIFPDFKSRP